MRNVNVCIKKDIIYLVCNSENFIENLVEYHYSKAIFFVIVKALKVINRRNCSHLFTSFISFIYCCYSLIS